MNIIVEQIEQVEGGFEVAWFLDEIKSNECEIAFVSFEHLKDFFEAQEYGVGFEDKFSYTSGHYTEDWDIPFEDYIEDSDNLKAMVADYLEMPD